MSTTNDDTGNVIRDDIDRMAQERARDRARISELEQIVENLQAQIEVLQERAPSLEQQQYDRMDREDKATVVRSKLKQEADATNGTAAVAYKDVVRMFDGQPSAGHAYDIMDTAAQKEGFDIGIDPQGKKRLTHKTGRVND
jgi:hypothetical protein